MWTPLDVQLIWHRVQNLNTGVQNLGTGVQNLGTGCSESDHNIKLLDQEGDQSSTSSSGPGDDDGQEDSPSGQNPKWTGDEQNALDNRAWLAERLGVDPGTIGAPLWRWLEDLDIDPERHKPAVAAAAQRAAREQSQVGYFKSILPGYLAGMHAEHDAGA